MKLPARKPSTLPARDVACDVALEAVAALPAQPPKSRRSRGAALRAARCITVISPEWDTIG